MVPSPTDSISSMAGPSKLTSISGTIPGAIDPSQPARLLRLSNSRLLFARFDPLTATAANDTPNVRNMSIDDTQYRPKRIVLEITPTGESFWRFVPKARLEEGVIDEGAWPRIIEICGELVECSQDQWDIYKLDTEYDCLVRAPPHLSVISRAPKRPHRDSSPPPFSKRTVPTSSPEKDTSRATKKKPNYREVSIADSSEEEEEGEVEEMVVDDSPRPRPGERSKKVREEIEKQRKLRREKIALAEAKYRQARFQDEWIHDIPPDEPTPQTRSVPPESATKRKSSSLFGYFQSPEEPKTYQGNDEDPWGFLPKRTRTVSPSSARRELEEKRMEREKRKKEKWEQKLEERRQERDRMFMEDIIQEYGTYANGVYTTIEEEEEEEEEEDNEDNRQLDEEAAREAAIAESRRKLAELEADRPLWEEFARKRAASEQIESEARRAKEERRQAAARQAEEERKLKVESEARESMLREEMARNEREARAKREKEKRQRHQRWSCGVWTVKRALERYKTLCATFDETKFTPEEPLTFDAVPWPVLHSPVSFTVEDVDWGAVEKFFEEVKPHMRTQDYKVFVQASQRRFHPDRWRARGLLKSIEDETERGCLEVAANSVAQALTPLWREVRGH